MKKYITNIKYKIEYWIRFWDFLKVRNSPLKPLKLEWYWGKIARGHPYFLPRRWAKFTEQDAIDAANERIRQHPRILEFQSKESIIESYKSHRKAVYLEYFAFDCNGLGWKTKYDDYRFEWSPSFSFIILGKQLNVTVIPDMDFKNAHIDSYWEAWLTWYYRTDKSLSFEERMISMFEQYSCTWTGKRDGIETSSDHYLEILKPEYLEIYKGYHEHTRRF